MTRARAKDIALSNVARWYLRAVEKKTFVQIAAYADTDMTEALRTRRPLLRAFLRPVRIP